MAALQSGSEDLKDIIRKVRAKLADKHAHEMEHWDMQHAKEGLFKNDWYVGYMLAMAGEDSPDFVENLTVADFGCGPRGSLNWAAEARATAIGLDVLIPTYADTYPDDIRSHGMIYVTATENVIPLPTDAVDIMYTMNALDHVQNLQVMCDELCRVIKPGGKLFASFNLNEPPTPAEPHELTEAKLDQVLLGRFESHSRRFGRAVEGKAHYSEMLDGTSTYSDDEEGYMWFSGTLK
ncbi:methyltransferase domain-containing protein [Altererythrobacter sp. ZODW24]|uniref:methyltransferase domain-containing protein n=1 Tax=Altererythrobacter sp. ZODW24 TaxID=2185142 RepID=UPI000DF83D74|nr:methyltransferase domain-containing protein [Altererythrobacter sp. ZODW24]